MNLIPLTCTKCGSPLSFNGSLICKCGSCQTPHALVDSGSSLLQSVSFLPFSPRTDGKMEKSLKMQLVAKTRDAGYVLHGVNFSIHSLRIGDNGTVYNRYLIGEDRNDIMVAKAWTKNEIVDYKGRLFGPDEPIYEDVIHYEDLFSLDVIPVEVDDGKNKILAGHRVVIGVQMPKYEDEANAFSEMVQQWFGIIPEVILSNG